MTALHFAAMNNIKTVAAVLVDSGAVVTSTANEGMTPLHAAACRNSVETAMFLVEKGASIYSKFMVCLRHLCFCVFVVLDYVHYSVLFSHRMELPLCIWPPRPTVQNFYRI